MGTCDVRIIFLYAFLEVRILSEVRALLIDI